MIRDRQITQRERIESLIAGDDDAWRELLRDVVPLVRSLGIKAGLDNDEIEEIAGMLIEKLLDKNCRVLKEFDSEKGSFFGWLKVTISRIILDRMRGEGRRKSYESEAVIERSIFGGRKSESNVEGGLIISRVKEKLNNEEKILLEFFLRDVPTDEIGRVMNLGEIAVEKRKSRLKEKMRSIAVSLGMVERNESEK